MQLLHFSTFSVSLAILDKAFQINLAAKGAFTNGIIILGWGEDWKKMTEDDGGGGCRAKDDVTFLTSFLGKFSNNLILKVGFIIRKLNGLSDCT